MNEYMMNLLLFALKSNNIINTVSLKKTFKVKKLFTNLNMNSQ